MLTGHVTCQEEKGWFHPGPKHARPWRQSHLIVLLHSTLSFAHQLTTMGVQVEVKTPGTGAKPQPGQRVHVHYTGTLTNGQKFDSSRDRGSPFVFTIGKGEVIKGWDEGVAQMSIGERSILTCSPDYAYGSREIPGLIPANSTLIFDVELLNIS